MSTPTAKRPVKARKTGARVPATQSKRAVVPSLTPVHSIRVRLFEAGAIIEAVRLAVCSQSETLDIETVIDRALTAAGQLIDSASSQLEGHDHV
jgi:hypothetical protein